MHETRNVLILHQTSSGYGRAVLRGVYQYASTWRPWELVGEWSSYGDLPDVPEDVDGVIAHVTGRRVVEALGDMPVVNVSGLLPETGLPLVGLDNRAIGRVGAEHFLARGFEHFAFCGQPDAAFSAARLAGYADRLDDNGVRPVVFGEPGSGDFVQNETETVACWLRDLPKPLALLAVNDSAGRAVCRICRGAGIDVPWDVAVVGVDNDDLICMLSRPPLSSVAIPGEKVGYEAARLLDRLMDGQEPPKEPVLLAPGDVVTRLSSDVTAVDDPEVARALKFIRAQVGAGLKVADVVARATVSRRVFETRFRKALGRTPLQEIHRARVGRAKQLLAETDRSVHDVALATGFANASWLTKVFRKITGTTPGRYRSRFRLE